MQELLTQPSLPHDPAPGLDAQDHKGRTPAHLVCLYASVIEEGCETEGYRVAAVLKRLESQGANLSVKDKRQRTPAHYCADPANDQSRQGLALLLTRGMEENYHFKGRSLRSPLLAEDMDGKTPKDVANSCGAKSGVNYGAAESSGTYNAVANQWLKSMHRQVEQLFPLDGSGLIRVPRGYLVENRFHGGNWFDVEKTASRCPNPHACPAQNISIIDVYSSGVCAAGYTHTACAQCAPEFGRSTGDPFVCQKCRYSWLQWVTFLGKQTGIYVFTLFTAGKAQEGRNRQSVLLKIALSFGTVVASVSGAVRSTDTVTEVMPATESEGAAPSKLSGMSFVYAR